MMASTASVRRASAKAHFCRVFVSRTTRIRNPVSGRVTSAAGRSRSTAPFAPTRIPTATSVSMKTA